MIGNLFLNKDSPFSGFCNELVQLLEVNVNLSHLPNEKAFLKSGLQSMCLSKELPLLELPNNIYINNEIAIVKFLF